MAETVKIKDGHTVSFDWNGVFVTDDSGERVEVDTGQDIMADECAFTIPLTGDRVTVGPAEEALLLASRTHMRISAGGRMFRVMEL